MHQRMRYFQVWFVDNQFVVEQDVDVYWSVVVARWSRRASLRSMFGPLAQFALYLLCGLKHFAGRKRGLTAHDTIQKRMVGLESPRLGFYQRRPAHYRPYPAVNESDGLLQQLPALAKIGAKPQIHRVQLTVHRS